MTDVIANNVSMIIDPILATGGPVRAGTVRALAITAERRSPAAPAVPTAAEQGFPSLDIQSWWGLWGPRGLAPEVTQRITEVLSTGMFDADIAPRVDNMGIEPAAEPAAEFARFIAADFARSEELLRLAHFQPE
jgi:tripartite-type tricarboxylate transporter receptor subunit TctC